MKTIKFKKDGSNRIKLGDQWYRPVTLEQVLNLQSAFYAGTCEADDIEDPTSEWFNFKGLTYIKLN